MAIVRTAKGTAYAYDDEAGVDRVELASVALVTGSSIIVLISSHKEFGGSSSVTWNGQALTQDAQVTNASGARVEVWAKHNVTGATGTVSAIWPANKIAFGLTMAVVQVEGLATSSAWDKASTATGVGISPSSGATATTAQADEYLVGLVGSALAGLDVGGTWDNSFSAGQAVNDANTIALSEGYRIVAATGAYTASKTGAVSGQWAAAIATYKANLNQTMTPSAVASVGAALAGALLIGVAAVASVGAASGPGSVLYGVSAVAGVGAVVAPESAGVVADSYSPTAATTLAEGIATFTMRAVSTMGDRRDDTGAASVTPGSWPTGAGTLTFAQNISGQNLPSFVIAHVIFGARGVMTQDGNYLSNLRFTVTGGSYALSGPWDDIRPYTLGSESYSARCKDARSAAVTTKPAGGAWTWADVQGLAGSAIKIDYANITTVGHFADVWVSEMYVEAYGPQGSYVIPLTRVLKAGNLRREFNIAETFNL